MMSEVQILDQVQPDERCDCPLDHCTPEERTLIEAVLASAKAEHALYAHFAQNGDPAKSYPVTEAAAMTRVIVTDAVQVVLKMRGMELGDGD